MEAIAGQLTVAVEQLEEAEIRATSDHAATWTGTAADSFRLALTHLPPEFRSLTSALTAAANAVLSFARSVDGYQTTALRLAQQIEEAEDDLGRSTIAHADAEMHAALVRGQHALATDPVSKVTLAQSLEAATEAVARWLARVVALGEELSKLRAEAATNRAAYDAAGAQAASSIIGAAGGMGGGAGMNGWLAGLAGGVAGSEGASLFGLFLTAERDAESLKDGIEASGSWSASAYVFDESTGGRLPDGQWTASAKLGATATANAQGKIGLSGASGSASVHASVGETDTVNGRVGDEFAGASATGTVFAGAKGQANVSGTLNKDGVDVQGGVSGFTGVQGNASGEMHFSGVSASGDAGVSAGVGADAHGELKITAKKVTIGGDLGVTLGIGGHIGGSVTVDPEQIGSDALHGAEDVGSGAVRVGDDALQDAGSFVDSL